jgi:hypothetical protein
MYAFRDILNADLKTNAIVVMNSNRLEHDLIYSIVKCII